MSTIYPETRNTLRGNAEVPVTIIVCCYNAVQTVAETLESLLSQSHNSLEVLVIDDGSTDGSMQVAQSVVLRDSRVRLICNEVNRGTAYTRMRGLTEAQTDLVMFFDSDDLAEPELVTRLLDKILEDTCILGVGCYGRYFNEAGDLGIQRIGPTSKEAFFEIFSKHKLAFMVPVTMFYRSAALEVGGYRQNIMPNTRNIRYEDFAEDLDLWCRMSDLGAQGRYFITIPVPLFRYRKPAGSLSTRNVRLMQLKMRWIKDCLRRRRNAVPELTLGDFVCSRSWFERMNDYRSDIAAKFYKQAGFAFSGRNYLKMGVFLLLTGIFSPKLVLQKIRTQAAQFPRLF